MSERSHSMPVPASNSLEEATNAFLDSLRAWVLRVVEQHPDGVPYASHDGGTFMVPWTVLAGSEAGNPAIEFMRRYRDGAKRHFEEAGQWQHGYWRKQEAHHGTEHFDIFLRALWTVAPDDRATVRQLEDAAEHIGNWVAGVPPWYDVETGLFRSMFLGTDFVGAASVNIPDHLRMASLLLLAFRMTGKERYYLLARDYGRKWAAALTEREELPVAVGPNGPLFGLGDDESTYRSFAGAAPAEFATPESRAENLIASGAPDLMLDLWQLSHEDRFRAAAERIIDATLDWLASPVAWQVQAAVGRHRAATRSKRYDAAVLAVPEASLEPIRELTIVPEVETRACTAPLGMRGDKPDWLDQDARPAPSPLLWALRAHVDDNQGLLTRAVDLAHTHFALAQRAFGDVTDHGCGSRSLVAVCRGHGRLNGAGVVTEVLEPALASPDAPP